MPSEPTPTTAPRLPFLIRAPFRLELATTLCFSVALSGVDGGVVSVLAKNLFAAATSPARLNLAVALLQAAPELANICSFLFANQAAGKPKVAMVNVLQLAVIGLIFVAALSPVSGAGLVMFVALVVLARVCWSGIVTLRPTIWRANFPREARARLVGRITTTQVLALSGGAFLLGSVLNGRPELFRVVMPALACFGLAAFFLYRRMPVRGERRLLLDERTQTPPLAPWRAPALVARVMRQDRFFAEFMGCMFLLGLGNLMLAAIMAILLAEQFALREFLSIILITGMPYAIMPLAIPLWARLLDRAHVVRFRSIHSWAFVLSTGVMMLGAILHRIELMFAGSALQAIAMGGGALAWNIGHHDFSPPSQTSQYMATHVTLNGVRGLMAPFLSVGLYELLKESGLEPLGLQPGAAVLAVSLLLCVFGALGFVRLNWKMQSTLKNFRRESAKKP
ncbi:MAG: hypothetical protein SFZ23_06025 [Planctomycetota bacterium]|nr:hypothetical protein [Planctomycetota bacterium]